VEGRGQRQGTGSVTDFGDVDLNAVRAALAARTPAQRRDMNDPAGPTFDPTRTDPFEGQFTVRLTVTSSEGKALRGVDRKVLTALDDPTLRPGFPKRLGTGGEAPLRYADLDADNVQELVLPTEDGLVHAYRPDGSELPGWPVRTETQFVARAHGASPALRASSRPRAAAGADDRRPHRRRPARDHHDGGGAHLRLARRRHRRPGWPGAPRSAAGQLRPRSAGQAAQAPEVRLPRVAVDRAARRPGRPALGRRRRPGRPPARVPARRHRDARLPGPAHRPRPAGRQADDGRVDQQRGDRRPRRRRARRGRDRHERGLRQHEQRRRRELLRRRRQRRRHDVARLCRALDRHRLARRQAVPPGWPIKLSGIIQDVLPLIGPGHDPAIYVEDGKPRIVVSTTGGALAIYAPTARGCARSSSRRRPARAR
jgi:hypothetical protein